MTATFNASPGLKHLVLHRPAKNRPVDLNRTL